MNIGILGAGRVAAYALITPSKSMSNITVAAVASRSPDRARAFAEEYGIEKVFPSYEAMLDDDEIDAIYVALPTALHPRWTIESLRRGKHVLCEKPLAPNSSEAAKMMSEAITLDRVLLEGMHLVHARSWRRLKELVKHERMGGMVRVICTCRDQIDMLEDDFRLRYDMGGGASMDLGCYMVACLSDVVDEDGGIVEEAEARCVRPDVDSWMKARIRYPSGLVGIVECGFQGDFTTDLSVHVECERGAARWTSNCVTTWASENTTQDVIPLADTFHAQLLLFSQLTRAGRTDERMARRSVENAKLIDAMYTNASLKARAAIL